MLRTLILLGGLVACLPATEVSLDDVPGETVLVVDPVIGALVARRSQTRTVSVSEDGFIAVYEQDPLELLLADETPTLLGLGPRRLPPDAAFYVVADGRLVPAPTVPMVGLVEADLGMCLEKGCLTSGMGCDRTCAMEPIAPPVPPEPPLSPDLPDLLEAYPPLMVTGTMTIDGGRLAGDAHVRAAEVWGKLVVENSEISGPIYVRPGGQLTLRNVIQTSTINSITAFEDAEITLERVHIAATGPFAAGVATWARGVTLDATDISIEAHHGVTTSSVGDSTVMIRRARLTGEIALYPGPGDVDVEDLEVWANAQGLRIGEFGTGVVTVRRAAFLREDSGHAILTRSDVVEVDVTDLHAERCFDCVTIRPHATAKMERVRIVQPRCRGLSADPLGSIDVQDLEIIDAIDEGSCMQSDHGSGPMAGVKLFTSERVRLSRFSVSCAEGPSTVGITLLRDDFELDGSVRNCATGLIVAEDQDAWTAAQGVRVSGARDPLRIDSGG